MQREFPLSEDDVAFITNAPSNPLELTGTLIDRKQPRWLMGWRDVTNTTSERTMILSVFPRVGANHKIPLCYSHLDANLLAALVAGLSSIPFDFSARQKLSGTSLTYFYFKQFPFFAPVDFSPDEIAFAKRRVLELTYTCHSMRPWAEDLGHTGVPFTFNPDRRAQLRAELDAFFARKYGMSRDELRYILDPADVHGDNYPSETFRGLKRNEIERYGEYRTRRLVLDAFDRLTGG